MWNFKGTLWNSTQNILPIHWEMRLLNNIEILRALRFKSSYAFLKHPPGSANGPESLLPFQHQIITRNNESLSIWPKMARIFWWIFVWNSNIFILDDAFEYIVWIVVAYPVSFSSILTKDYLSQGWSGVRYGLIITLALYSSSYGWCTLVKLDYRQTSDVHTCIPDKSQHQQ